MNTKTLTAALLGATSLPCVLLAYASHPIPIACWMTGYSVYLLMTPRTTK
jgi:hypothetical protein